MLPEKKILIKGMVCDRCILSIKNELEKTGVQIADIYLGEATILHTEGLPDFHLLNEKLTALGFRFIEDKKEKIIRQVKELVKEVYSGDFDFPNHFRFSTFVESRIDKDYDTVSAFFTAAEKTTIEKYIVDYRIKKIKEYLVYSDLTLSDLSFKFGFSSVAHLSRQFKSHTGLNPSHFKDIRKERLATINQEN
jgi:YesN/AraC family two-component response regulator